MMCKTVDEWKTLFDDVTLVEFKEAYERPAETSDYVILRSKIEKLSQEIVELLRADCYNIIKIQESFSKTGELCIHVYTFCAENSVESLWTSKTTVDNCKFIYCHVFGPEEARQTVLLEERGKLMKKFICRIRVGMHSSQWKNYPSTVNCFMFCLTSLRAPYLGEFLDILLPYALTVTDDFEISYKILGVKCLHHIVKNVTFAELRIRSHEEVIYKSLESCIGQRNPELIPMLISSLLDLLKKMYFLSTDQLCKWTHYDEVMTKFLYRLKMESDIEIKEVMLESLIKLINSSGFIYIRYLGNIVEIIDESSAYSPCVLVTLKLMMEVLRVRSPCVEHYFKQLTFIILKILYSWDSYKTLTFEEIKEGCKEVLICIHSINHKVLQEVTCANQFSKLQIEVRSTIEEIASTPKSEQSAH